jgi:hypothetical protein
MEQRAANGHLIGQSQWSLIPPGSDDFAVYGSADTVRRAREWAFANEYLLYRGPSAACVHGLYRMDSCGSTVCGSVGMDHTQIWVQPDGRNPFILTHPYVDKIPTSLRTYAAMHGLSASSWGADRWYSTNALPIRLTVPDRWPLWPIERDVALLLHVAPIRWPEEDPGRTSDRWLASDDRWLPADEEGPTLMNIRDVIDQLAAHAADMPAGLDTEVRVVMCDGTAVDITRVIEVDNMAVISETDNSVQEVFVIVKGHSHLDETSSLRGVSQDADEQLRRWTEAEPGPPPPPAAE